MKKPQQFLPPDPSMLGAPGGGPPGMPGGGMPPNLGALLKGPQSKGKVKQPKVPAKAKAPLNAAAFSKFVQ